MYTAMLDMLITSAYKVNM